MKHMKHRKGTAGRLAVVAGLLILSLLLSSCSVWRWMWAEETVTPPEFSDLIIGADDTPYPNAVAYDPDETHTGTDIYYIGTGANKDYIIVIDAGHQAKANNEKEPIGPGSDIMKPKVSQGAEGEKTGSEYAFNLSVALFLRDELYARGYSVVMIRETDDVDISNKERAEIANKYQAAAYVRIHANSSDNTEIKGALTMCPTAANPYPACAARYEESRLLSETVLDAFCEATSRDKREIIETDDMTGLNWANVPSTIVEMGFLSNPSEDSTMANIWFHRDAAEGIANGIDAYIKALPAIADAKQ